MTTHRAKPQNVEFSEPMKFNTQVNYQTGDAKDVIGGENYFLNCRHLVKAGDEIRVTCMRDDGTWDKALFEVALWSEHAVVVQQTTDWRHGGMVAVPNVKAVHEGFGKWRIEDQHGKVLRRGLSKAEAYALAGMRLEERGTAEEAA